MLGSIRSGEVQKSVFHDEVELRFFFARVVHGAKSALIRFWPEKRPRGEKAALLSQTKTSIHTHTQDVYICMCIHIYIYIVYSICVQKSSVIIDLSQIIVPTRQTNTTAWALSHGHLPKSSKTP